MAAAWEGREKASGNELARPFCAGAQRMNVGVDGHGDGPDAGWLDPADRELIGVGEPAVRRDFPQVDEDGPAQGPALETPFLGDAYPEDWKRLERHAVRQRFRTGDVIIRQGEFERSLIIVLSGELSFVVTDRAGEERLLDVIEAPSLVGEVGFFDPGPMSGTLRAHSDGELLRLGFSRFEALAASSPLLARRILLDAGRFVASRLRRATEATLGTVG